MAGFFDIEKSGSGEWGWQRVQDRNPHGLMVALQIPELFLRRNPWRGVPDPCGDNGKKTALDAPFRIGTGGR